MSRFGGRSVPSLSIHTQCCSCCSTLRHRSILRGGVNFDESSCRIGEMASGESVRLSKLSTEAFSRLRSDHEQFLEAYESEL